MGVVYSVNKNYFENWSHEMAYILGYIYADGSLEYSPNIRGKYLRIVSTDLILLETIRDALKSEHNLVKRKKISKSHSDGWLLRIGNAYLYDSLVRLGLSPKKSLTVRMPNIPPRYLHSFILGYFDGDGCVYLEKSILKDGTQSFKRLRVVFTSGSLKFLKDLNKTLAYKHKEFRNEKIYKSSRAYRLVMSTKQSLLLFKFMYKNVKPNLFLYRKFDKFNRYLDNENQEIPKDIRVIQKRLA